MTRLQQNRLKFTLTFLLAILVCQNDLLAQRNDRFGLTFLDPKFPKKEPLANVVNPARKYSDSLEIEQMRAFYSVYSTDSIDYFDFEADFTHFDDYILNHPSLSNDEKAKYCFRRAKRLMAYAMTDGIVYNIDEYIYHHDIYDSLQSILDANSDLDYFDLLDDSTTMMAALEVIHYFQVAASYASDKNDRSKILIHLIDYTMQSGTLSYIFDRVKAKKLSDLDYSEFYISGFPYYCSNLKNNEETDRYKKILMTVYHAYVETSYSGDILFNHITPALNMRYDSDFWIGGEIAIDFSQHRYLYAIRPIHDETVNVRISLLHFGMNFNLNQTSQREYYFGLLRFSHIQLVHLKLVQFGFIQNVPQTERNLWFYRPQIGLSYGNFQLFYSFTQPLKKDYRQLVPRHAINLRIVFPYFRVNGYSNY